MKLLYKRQRGNCSKRIFLLQQKELMKTFMLKNIYDNKNNRLNNPN